MTVLVIALTTFGRAQRIIAEAPTRELADAFDKVDGRICIARSSGVVGLTDGEMLRLYNNLRPDDIRSSIQGKATANRMILAAWDAAKGKETLPDGTLYLKPSKQRGIMMSPDTRIHLLPKRKSPNWKRGSIRSRVWEWVEAHGDGRLLTEVTKELAAALEQDEPLMRRVVQVLATQVYLIQLK